MICAENEPGGKLGTLRCPLVGIQCGYAYMRAYNKLMLPDSFGMLRDSDILRLKYVRARELVRAPISILCTEKPFVAVALACAEAGARLRTK